MNTYTIEIVALTTLAILGLSIVIILLARELLHRIVRAYVMLAVYRMLPLTFVPTVDLVDEIILRSRASISLRNAFRFDAIDRKRIKAMLDTLVKLGLAEQHERPDARFERERQALLQDASRLAEIGAAFVDLLALREFDNMIKDLRKTETVWRKKFRGNAPEPKLSDFLTAQD